MGWVWRVCVYALVGKVMVMSLVFFQYVCACGLYLQRCPVMSRTVMCCSLSPRFVCLGGVRRRFQFLWRSAQSNMPKFSANQAAKDEFIR